MGRDVIRSLRLKNVRTFRDATISTEGLKVLIGENGSGKSTIVEVFEILRSIGEGTFAKALVEVHGGASSLVRGFDGSCEIEVTIQSDQTGAEAVSYLIELATLRRGHLVVREEVRVLPADGSVSFAVLSRSEVSAEVYRSGELRSAQGSNAASDGSLLTRLTGEGLHPAISTVVRALSDIEVQVGFDVMASWVTRKVRRPESSMRDRMPVTAESRLELLGANLAAAYFTLHNEPPHKKNWSAVLAHVQLGFGAQIEDVLTPVAGSGQVELAVQFRGIRTPVTARSLSNGTLAWLALVAMVHLGADRRSLLVIDEPELHLHPRLLARATQYLHTLSGDHPVLLATHSRRILDLLGDEAADATLVCELDEGDTSTNVRTVDREALLRWQETYDGLGQLTDAGLLRSVLRDTEEVADDAATPVHGDVH